MKEFQIKLGGVLVRIRAKRHSDGIIFYAEHDGTTREGMMAMHVNPKLERTSEQHLRDVEEFTQNLARECLEHHKKEKILDDFFADDNGSVSV